MKRSIKVNNKKFWLEHEYPCTIIKDRYTGAYSRGKWTCWPCDFDDIPDDIESSDIPCGDFWRQFDKNTIGIGDSPEEAVKDLRQKLGDKNLGNKSDYDRYEEDKLISQPCFSCQFLSYGCLGQLGGCEEWASVGYNRLQQIKKTLFPKDKISEELYKIDR